jgi:hypothetical protein
MGERGQALVESIVASAIASIVAIAVLGAAVVANAQFGPNPAQEALESAASRQLYVAQNLEKYQGTTLRPASVPTTVPLADGSHLPATLSLNTTPLAEGALRVTITASATWRNKQYTAALSRALAPPVPPPGSVTTLDGLVPAPTGAP